MNAIDIIFRPDWISGVTTSFAYLTTITTAINTKEQRAGLRDWPLRSMTVDFFVNALDAGKLRNKLKELAKTEMVVPIFSEQFECTNEGTLDGVNEIHTNAGSRMFNLRSVPCGLGVFDRTGVYEPEYAQIGEVTDSQVTLIEGGIEQAIEASNALFYPVMYAWLTSYSESHETNGHMVISATFAERRVWPSAELVGALLKEDGEYLLLETGGEILLEG